MPPPPPRPQPVYPGIGEAPAYLKYMSPRCASLNDALRTAHARGLKYETINTMGRNYETECGEDEREAKAQYTRDNIAQRQQQYSDRRSQVAAQNQAQQHSQQCEESKRILIAKRNRPDLSENERAELQRFETNYRARCSP
jgi:hypothetical protein